MGRKQEPNEVTEMWREHRRDLQERRATRRATRTDDIMALRDRGFTVRALTPYHFRINNVLDLYPTCNRFHNLLTQKRGSYQTVEKIVASQL